MSYRQLAEDIIKHIGTEKNVHSLVIAPQGFVSP